MVAYLVVGLVVLFVWIGNGDPIDGAVTAINELTRGERLTHSPADSTGLVADDPDTLWQQVPGATQESYSAARMLGSEEPRTDPATQAAICWALINESSRRGTTITALLVKAKNARNDGYYGSQMDKDPTSSNYKGSDRYATTALDPYQRELDIANQCLSGQIPDPTGGATNFDRAGEEKNPDKVAADRVASGLQLVSVPSADSDIRFWRSA
jgi:hypothetical protein